MIINRNGKQNNIHNRNSSNSVTSGHTCACNTVEPMTHSYWSFCHFCIVCDNLREEGSRDRPLDYSIQLLAAALYIHAGLVYTLSYGHMKEKEFLGSNPPNEFIHVKIA